MMQIALFSASSGDTQSLDELNRFLRGHRVLTLDRQFREGGWAFCVTYQSGPAHEAGPREAVAKIDYKQVLDAPTFALFSRLRDIRKTIAEKEKLPPYAIFTNEQLACIARERCSSVAALSKIDGIGTARIEKYAAAILAITQSHHEEQPGAPGTDR
jgi:superfamily II DNA helicase RecQ